MDSDEVSDSPESEFRQKRLMKSEREKNWKIKRLREERNEPTH